MQDGLDHIRGVLGEEETSGLSDKVIKDALWEFFFDTEKTIEWALGLFLWNPPFVDIGAQYYGQDEQQRILQARERKGKLSCGIFAIRTFLPSHLVSCAS